MESKYRVIRVSPNGWDIEALDENGVWVLSHPGSPAYHTEDEAQEACDELIAFRRECSEREFIDGFADGADISVREAREAWASFSRQMSDSAREEEEQQGRERGITLGMEYRSL
jgi:hypothetical protein